MAQKRDRTPTSIKIDPDLLKKVKLAVIERGQNQTEAIEDGLRMWLEKGEQSAEVLAVPHENPYSITPDELQWLTLIRAADRAALDKTWRGLVDSAKQILVQAAKVARDRAKE